MARTKQQSALAKALQALKSLQDTGAASVLHGSSILGASNTRQLVQNGFLEQVLKGWYIPSSPAHAGTTVTWYASYWAFVAAYCNSRFGNDWCLTPEESISVLSGANIIPQQVVVRVLKGSNSIQPLPHDTSIFNITAKLPPRIDKDQTYGLNIYPLAEALLRCSPAFYASHPIETRACLLSLKNDESLAAAVLDVGGGTYAGRLVGALKAIGSDDVADEVRHILKADGRRIEESNPFERTFDSIATPERSPAATRLRLLWAEMRERILPLLPVGENPPVLRPLADILKDIDDSYVADSYHSLSIEGYKVSEDLIRRVMTGDWDPTANANDQDQKNALAASGYYRAYRKVRATIEAILNGADAGTTIADNITDWHRELFMPCVDAGIMSASDLAGYRHSQVYIAGSRYTPPSAAVLADVMESFFDLVRTEKDYRIRAILGHFFFVHVHPYADGNGRTARFIMNASLVASGGRWIVIPVAAREHYMKSLESASVDGRIEEFVALLKSLWTSTPMP